MIAFSLTELILSVIYALIFGAAFAFGQAFLSIAGAFIYRIPFLAYEIAKSKQVLSPIKATSSFERRFAGPIGSFITIILFSLGFVILSYYALDGLIRIYMLIFAFAAFYLSKITFFNIFNKLIYRIFDFICFGLAVILRILLLPFAKLWNLFMKKAKKNKK